MNERLVDRSRPVASQPQKGSILTILTLLRPAHWVKNVVIFAGPAAAMKLSDPASIFRSLLAFAAFCLVASGAYALNDVIDRKADAAHPQKRTRPVASGALQPWIAIVVGLVFLALGLAVTAPLADPKVTLVVLAYSALTLTYSLFLKTVILVDVMVIAVGFVLRAWAGSLAVGVPTSEWLVACMFTLCLFMGFGKRRCEQAMFEGNEEAGRHRKTLIRYTPDLLNHLISVSAGIAVMTFLLYTMDASGSSPPFRKERLFLTLPLVIYGIFRYAMVTELGMYGGPTEIVLRDRPLMIAIFLWAVSAMVVVYS